MYLALCRMKISKCKRFAYLVGTDKDLAAITGSSLLNTKPCLIPFLPRCLQECHVHVRDTLQLFYSSPAGRWWSASPSSMLQFFSNGSYGYVLGLLFPKCTLTTHWTRRSKCLVLKFVKYVKEIWIECQKERHCCFKLSTDRGDVGVYNIGNNQSEQGLYDGLWQDRFTRLLLQRRK